MSGIVYILRGIPGCGKSTLAKNLIKDKGVICEADNYFISDIDGIYRYDVNKIGLAHGWCKDVFCNALESKIPVIVVSNTNIDPAHFSFYEEKARAEGYQVFHMIVENRHGGTNEHNVPEETLQRMENVLKKSIKLR